MVIAISDIELYEALKAPLGENGAKTLVNFVEGKVESGFQVRLDTFATKSDIALLKKDIADLRVEIARTESRLIKWMFIFLIGQLAAIIGVVKLL